MFYTVGKKPAYPSPALKLNIRIIRRYCNLALKISSRRIAHVVQTPDTLHEQHELDTVAANDRRSVMNNLRSLSTPNTVHFILLRLAVSFISFVRFAAQLVRDLEALVQQSCDARLTFGNIVANLRTQKVSEVPLVLQRPRMSYHKLAVLLHIIDGVQFH